MRFCPLCNKESCAGSIIQSAGKEGTAGALSLGRLVTLTWIVQGFGFVFAIKNVLKHSKQLILDLIDCVFLHELQKELTHTIYVT